MQKQNPFQFPALKTERLVLRRLAMDDAPELVKLRSDERVNKYLDRPKSTTYNEALEFIVKIDMAVNKGDSFYWVICLHNENRLIGTICFWNIDKENLTAEVGYEMHPDFQGKGLMQEALTTIIEFGFKTPQFKSIVAYPNSANERSIKLLEKNNFKRDKTLEDEYYGSEGSGNEVIYLLKSRLI